MTYILSIDQGTTGTRACLIDIASFKLVGHASLEYPQIFPEPSWVEHNLNDIWSTVESTITSVLKKCNVQATEIAAIGITNQRETTCAFNKEGIPLANAIVWQDRRTHKFCQQLTKDNHADKIKQITGLPIDPYFSATKMHWLLNNNQKVQDAAKKNDLLFGTIDAYLLYRLTKGSAFKTDASNASRTMLMNLTDCSWNDELLKLFGIEKNMLPEISDSFAEFGKTKGLSCLPDGIPITGILGDQQSALFGQAGFNKGDMKCTYGTGAFALLNTGSDIVYSKHGLLTTVGFKHKGETSYALEGSSYIAGAAVQWLRDNLKIINKSSEIEPLAREVKNLKEVENVVFFPFFSGIGSPHWNPEAKAALIGLTRDTSRHHIALVTLEGIALTINDLILAFRRDTGLSLDELKVDGGASANSYLMEMQATYTKTKIIRPMIIETTAYGVAMGAALGASLKTMEELSALWKKDCEFNISSSLVSYAEKKQVLWDQYIGKNFI